jgi:hypothetical protein
VLGLVLPLLHFQFLLSSLPSGIIIIITVVAFIVSNIKRNMFHIYIHFVHIIETWHFSLCTSFSSDMLFSVSVNSSYQVLQLISWTLRKRNFPTWDILRVFLIPLPLSYQRQACWIVVALMQGTISSKGYWKFSLLR